MCWKQCRFDQLTESAKQYAYRRYISILEPEDIPKYREFCRIAMENGMVFDKSGTILEF